MSSHEQTQRVACYVRVSSQEQKLRGLSPDAQRETLTRYAEANNLRIVEWYEDLGVSGRKLIKKRPALQQMIQDAEAGYFDRIIFIKLDRYFRSVGEYYECQKRLDAKNVVWTATEEKYDLTTASGRYWVTQKLAMAEYEADQVGERVSLINEYKVKTGQPLTGNLGIAWTVEKDENGVKKVVQDKTAEPIVYDFINHFLIYQNKNTARKYINEKYNKSYSHKALSRVLKDTKLYGHYRGNDNYCPAYINKATFDKLQEISQKNIKERKNKRIYLFTGLIRCPICGARIVGTTSNFPPATRNGKTYTYETQYQYYRCNAALRDGECDFHKTVSEAKIEKNLLENLSKYVTDFIEEIKIEDIRKKEDNVHKKIAQIKSEMSRLNNMYLKHRITEEKYDTEYEELESRCIELEKLLKPIEERDLSKYEELLKSDWQTIYYALTRENKRAFWRKYIKEIKVDEKGIFKDVIFF